MNDTYILEHANEFPLFASAIPLAPYEIYTFDHKFKHWDLYCSARTEDDAKSWLALLRHDNLAACWTWNNGERTRIAL